MFGLYCAIIMLYYFFIHLMLKDLGREYLAMEALKNFTFLRKATSKGRVFLYCKKCGFNENVQQSRQWFVKDICRNFDFNMREHAQGIKHIEKGPKTQTLISSFLATT